MIDYSIHFLEQEHLLIAHMRYIGNDYEGDMAQIGKSEATQKWWKVCPFLLGFMISALHRSLSSLKFLTVKRGRTKLMSR
jgi:L-rhamnose mutarotase